MIKQLYGLEKNGDFKVWSIEVFDNKVCEGDENVQVFISVKHGKEGGNLTEKIDEVKVGKQGRSVFEQAVFEANAKVKKRMDAGYRESKSELNDLPLLAMLASDYNKVGHRITFPCYTSVKYDGVRCLATKHADHVYLKSRTGQEFDIPSVSEALREVMHDGEVLDGEIYIHGVELQDILSAVKRSDEKCESEIAKKWKAVEKNGSSEAWSDYNDALMVKCNRDRLEFHIFDIPMDGDFEERYAALCEHQETRPSHPRVKYCVYNYCAGDNSLRNYQHPEAIRMGYEGVMIRNMKGVYESGKRSADLQKYKTFFDEEFEIVRTKVDKDGNAVFDVLNNVKSERHVPGIEYINGYAVFSCVLGDHEFRKKVAAMDPLAYAGKFMTVKFQTRYKGTLLPQFPTGVLIRDGKLINGEFTPSV